MVPLLTLVALVFVAAPFVAVVLAILAFRRLKEVDAVLRRQHEQVFGLERRLRRVEAGPAPSQPGPPEGAKPEQEEAPTPPAAAGPPPPPRAAAAPPPEARPVPPAPVAKPVVPATPPPTAGPREPASPVASPPGARSSMEANLGLRAFVWMGAVALALAGIFLVKYTFDRGLIGPATRVGLGIVFGVALLGGAEWLRARSARVAQGLSGAGIAVLFAAFLAGVNLYALIPRPVGFGLMALTAATAVALSLRHGAIIALLGLAGGFLTPALIGSREPHAAGLFGYLLVLQIGLLVVTRRRRWWILAALTLVASMLWAWAWIFVLGEPGRDVVPVGLFLLASVAAFVATTRDRGAAAAWGDPRIATGLGWAGAGLGLLALATLVGRAGFGPTEWMLFGILGAGCVVLARLDERYEGLAWAAAAMTVLLLWVWVPSLEAREMARFTLTASALGVLFAGGAYAGLWGSSRAERWAALSGASALAFFLVQYAGYEALHRGAPWGAASLGVAAAFTLMAWAVARRRERIARGELTLAALAVAVTAFVSLAIPLELERAWITVAWAVEVPALAWLASRLRVPQLRVVGGVVAAAVAVRLLLNPAVLDYPTGSLVLFNWLLYGYGIPVAAFLVAARRFREDGAALLSEGLEAAAVLFGFALATLEIRHYFHSGRLAAPGFPLAELGAFAVAWMLYGWALYAGARRLPRRPLRWGGPAIATAGLVECLALPVLIENPAWSAQRVGDTAVLNSLLFVYGLPAGLAQLVAVELKRHGRRWPARIFGAASLLLSLVLVSLEVRQAFRGSDLAAGSASFAELYSYSAAWILFGVALLVLGIATGGVVLRYGSLVVMLLAVGKVFLFDTAHLRDLYRVGSLLGLGMSLLVLAFLYQKYVFRERAS